MPADAETMAVAAELKPKVRAIDLREPTSIHIVGIGGAGMRAIARVLVCMGHRVSGSDRASSDELNRLAELGVTVHAGHDAGQVANADIVTRSTAVPDDNPEVVAALSAGVPVVARADILAAISQAQPAILVAGTHGKTTTSAMLAVLLDHAGLAPSFVVGADVGYFGTGARWGEAQWSVIEADESDGTFLALEGAHAVVTSLDPDHLEFYGTADRLRQAFDAFVDQVAGTIAVCADDADTVALRDRRGVITYGTHPEADLRIRDVVVSRDQTRFEVSLRGESLGTVTVGLAGHHNALNAAAALTIALSIGVPFDVAAHGLASFTGVERRFERRGASRGVTFIDDYAHLPTEVEAALATAAAGDWSRVVCVYQPHRYSRTEALGASFASSFALADHVVLTDIYPAGEAPRPGVSGRVVHEAVVAACPELSVSWQPSLDDVVDHLVTTLEAGDVCLTLGAGDLTMVPDLVMNRLSRPTVSSRPAWLDPLAGELTSSRALPNEPLGPHTTYRVGGAAAALIEVGSLEDLLVVVRGAQAGGVRLLIIGRGSNMLVSEAGFDGIAIVLGEHFSRVEISGTSVVAGAAAALPSLARQTVAAGLSGFEWAVGVPGTIGGAITMNAGGHGSDMAASVVSATVLDLETGQVSSRPSDALAFAYRSSSISPAVCVLDATLELTAGAVDQGEDLISEIVRWRREHQPGGQNAGSVFANPEGDSAGRLIDACGAKGLRVGSAVVSDKHANFIQADPDGSADDVFELMRVIVQRVEAYCGLRLQPETRLIGFPPFRPADPNRGDL